MKAGVCVLMALLLGASACGGGQAPAGTVDRLETRVEVGADGGLQVRDVFTIVPDAGGAIAFRHVVRSPYSDGVAFAAAAIDDGPLEPGGGGLAVDADGERVVVRWTAQGVERPVRLALDYHVTAAIAIREPRGRLAWPVLTAGRRFEVGAVDVTLELPDGVRTYDGTGMAEAGWTVELTPRGMIARRDGVGAGESATLLAVFDVDRARVAEPEWERHQDQQRQYSLALVGAAMFIFIVGAGVLAQMRVQYPPPAAAAPPDVLAAARATRRDLARGLRIAAGVALVFALLCAWLASVFLRGLVPLVHVIPGSIGIVAAMFVAAAWWYGRRTASGLG